jgi:hypothetical protein
VILHCPPTNYSNIIPLQNVVEEHRTKSNMMCLVTIMVWFILSTTFVTIAQIPAREKEGDTKIIHLHAVWHGTTQLRGNEVCCG